MSSLRDFFIDLNLEDSLASLENYASHPGTWIQLGIILGCILFSWWAGSRVVKLIAAKPELLERITRKFRIKQRLRPFRLVLLIALWIATMIYDATNASCATLKVSTLLFTAFMIVTLPTKFLKSKFWIRLASITVFIVASLYIVGLYDEVIKYLGETNLPLLPWDRSLLDIVKGSLTLVVALWLAGILSRILIRRIDKLPEVPPTIRVLLGKTAHLTLYALAIVITIHAFGINLGALAVFGGALGLGLGFGLQKVVSNLFSGLIILLDKSIKPGDVIEIAGTYGWINSLRGRYVSVITRDNKEHLIPNEDLITQPVINWSFSNRLVRLKAPIGIAYSADVRLAIELCAAAASNFERVLTDPAPRCLLRGFGDNSIDLEIRFWINDPSNGTANITSDVLLAVWDSFRDSEIEIPFPQRDIHIRSTVPFPKPD